MSVALVGVALADVLWGQARPLRFFGPERSPWVWVPWGLTLVAILIRFWGAGNLHKKQELTRTGIYRMVRHPLYLGNCLIYLAFFLALGDPVLGIVLFLLLVLGVHYPLMIQEEVGLAARFPQELDAYYRTPRLLPNLLALPEALATDRFSWRQALRNRAAGVLWVPVALPLMAEALVRVREYV